MESNTYRTILLTYDQKIGDVSEQELLTEELLRGEKLNEDEINEMASDKFRTDLCTLLIKHGAFDIVEPVNSTIYFRAPKNISIGQWHNYLHEKYNVELSENKENIDINFHFVIAAVAVDDDGEADMLSVEKEGLNARFVGTIIPKAKANYAEILNFLKNSQLNS